MASDAAGNVPKQDFRIPKTHFTMTTYAVTAASGQLGAAIVRALLETVDAGNVIALARTHANVKASGIEIRPGDYDDPIAMQQSLRGVDRLLIVAGMDAPEKRIGQHRNVIQAASEAGVKKLVYTSIQGAETGTGFSPVVQSNRQTEEDVKASGLEWSIGRNGIYIEPDVDYLENYKQRGGIYNCAGEGKCGYTTRAELATAYARLLVDSKQNEQTFNLHGEAISQTELADYLNQTFGTALSYHEMTVEEYRADRIAELGEFIGSIIAGIYQGIQQGAMNNDSQFERVVGREHQSWETYFQSLS